MPGRAELQSGAALTLGAAIGLALLAWWNSGSGPIAPGTAFSTHGYAAGVIAIMLIGVLSIGVLLIALGAILWLLGRRRAERERWHSGS